MHEARVKEIRLHSSGITSESDEELHLWELAYDYSEPNALTECPMIWRAYAQDELDMWVQFNKWFNEQAQGRPNNVIWIRV